MRRLAYQPVADLSARCPPPRADLAQATRTSAPSAPGTERARTPGAARCAHSERFADCAPRTVYARLLDEGVYLASVRTMYRLLAAEGQSRERRNQRVHPAYAKPELLRALPLVPGGEPRGALVLMRDVTELRRRDRQILGKDATIREIHHRVKNNLQTVAALLRLQARGWTSRRRARPSRSRSAGSRRSRWCTRRSRWPSTSRSTSTASPTGSWPCAQRSPRRSLRSPSYAGVSSAY